VGEGCFDVSDRRFTVGIFAQIAAFMEASHVGGWLIRSWRTTEPRYAVPISRDQPSHMPRPQRLHCPRLLIWNE
jgi:hypothetical protein